MNIIEKKTIKTESGCWEWQGATNGRGYGQVRINYKLKQTHRLSWELYHMPIPSGMFVLHRCDNRLCCNPDHLFLGSYKDNLNDMVSKARDRFRGEHNGQAKLADTQVEEIRSMLASGVPQHVIASKYSVNQTTISNINTGKRRGKRGVL